MPAAIRTQGLLKRFKTMTAVDHIDVQVPAGQSFSLLSKADSLVDLVEYFPVLPASTVFFITISMQRLEQTLV